MSCLIVLCPTAIDVRASARALCGHSGVSKLIVNVVRSKRSLTTMETLPVDASALLQVWTAGEYQSVIEEITKLELYQYYIVDREVFIAPNSSHALLKRMSLLQRTQGLSSSDFHEIWRNKHGPRVSSHNGPLLGYCQNHVLKRSEASPQCDGVTELWFSDEETMNSVLPSAPRHKEALTVHAADFIGGISTFLISEEQCK